MRPFFLRFSQNATDKLLADTRSKSGDIIESVMKPQWWVATKTLADEAVKVRFLAPSVS